MERFCKHDERFANSVVTSLRSRSHLNRPEVNRSIRAQEEAARVKSEPEGERFCHTRPDRGNRSDATILSKHGQRDTRRGIRFVWNLGTHRVKGLLCLSRTFGYIAHGELAKKSAIKWARAVHD